MSKQQPNYGIDAPNVVRKLLGFGAGLMFAGVVAGVFPNLRVFLMPSISIGATLFLAGAIMLWGSLKGKPKLFLKTLKSLSLQGDEKILEIGCGDGLLIVNAAKLLTKGRATGIDANKIAVEKTRLNAKIEGVEKKVEVQKADARSLPFPNESFDVVLSAWTLHKIENPDEREKALREIIRVTKKSGKIAVIDYGFAQDYAVFFARNGFENIKLSRPYFLFVFPSFVLTGDKKTEAEAHRKASVPKE